MFFVNNADAQYMKKLLDIEQKIKADQYEAAQKKLKAIDTTLLSKANHAFYNRLSGDCYEAAGEDVIAFKLFLSAKKKYIAADSLDAAMDLNLDIAYLLIAQENINGNEHKYLNETVTYLPKTKNLQLKANTYFTLGMVYYLEGKNDESLHYYREAKKLNKSIGNKTLEISINNNIAVLFNEGLSLPDSALVYLDYNYEKISKTGNINDLSSLYLNQAISYMFKKDHKKSIEILKIADKLPLNFGLAKNKTIIYDLLELNYEKLNDYKNAHKYLLLNKQYTDSLNLQEQNIAITEIQTRNQTKEKELENSVLKGNLKIQQILLYASIALLIILVFIGFLIVKNSRRKEKIALQNKLIEQQKFEKALKDYELSSIDIMLEGQEKERQRIANDLHDNLGSMLATLKLNFENLRLRKNELWDEENKLYDRTDELIEEAYQKVRRLAHAKNAGVFASEGLIPAIKKLADKISIPGKLNFQVIAFGFTGRLDNTLEIAVFRIVQELSTNIIKHSKATEATIHLTHHDDNSINIIIEDNGVGFNPGTVNYADGMGLATIRKKTIQLGGNFSIDATPGKGTTIIIDLPV